MKIKQLISLGLITATSVTVTILAARPAQAMHIMEGFLPVTWAIFCMKVSGGDCHLLFVLKMRWHNFKDYWGWKI
ncbi:hypothetical protein [Coleofasciculus sp. G2-EDA-02]|uniref:hypothetical protein n=1 Tax=Coleofasciculus sp. G2-EDA-02 TaxID=3069529 RepID=UPI0032FA550C